LASASFSAANVAPSAKNAAEDEIAAEKNGPRMKPSVRASYNAAIQEPWNP
jgi:hypothetical protein